MGQLKDQLFLEHINKSLTNVRRELGEKHTPKKDSRFLIKGLTYEIGACQVDGDDFSFEISSKIPEDLLFYQKRKEKYFKKVLSILKKGEKKPSHSKMENIVRNTRDEELKERDYVNVTYHYKESSLYTMEDVQKRLKFHYSKNIPLPDVPGIATPGGKMVVILIEEGIAKRAKKLVQELVKANDIAREEVPVEKAPPPPKPKKKSAPTKSKVEPKTKPKAKVKSKAKAKPKAKVKTKAKTKVKAKAKAKAKPAKTAKKKASKKKK